MANTKGISSKGIKLKYSTSSGSSITYTALTNLQNIPSLGGTTDSLETTTMDDSAHTYCKGLISYGDSLDFVFLYEKTQFNTLQALTGDINWEVELPDGGTSSSSNTKLHFTGECAASLDAVGVNAPMTYTLSIKPSSAIE